MKRGLVALLALVVLGNALEAAGEALLEDLIAAFRGGK